jgi:hypothetical protein
MLGDTPETKPDVISKDSAGAAHTITTRTTISEFQKIENALRSMGKDPATTSLSEAKEIAHLLSYSSHHVDRTFYRWIFAVLGIFVVVTVIGMVIIALSGKTIPDGLVVIGSVALGLFAGVLVTSGRDE